MSKILAMDDLQKGMFVTVFRGPLCAVEHYGPKGPRTRYVEDKSYNGRVLRIKIVEMPYFVVEFYGSCMGNLTTKSLDARDRIFSRISNEYVKALEPKFKDVEFIKEEEWVFEEEKKNNLKAKNN